MTKQTIIMLHGFRGTHHGLQLIAKRLTNFEVIVPDLPGFGKGPTMERYDLESYVAWVHEFIAEHSFKRPPVLLGHSFGSIIASAYAAKYPKTISKLILENPIGAPALEGPKAFMSQLALFYYWTAKKMPSRVAHAWLSWHFVTLIITLTMTKTKDKKTRAYIHDQHNKHFSQFYSAQSVAEGFKTSISHNVRDFAKKISIPTLLIVADQDDITSLAQQKELHRLFPQARLEIIENVGHLTHYETPGEVAAFIQDFTKEV